MTPLNKQALIAKIKKQTESFDTVVLKEGEANLLVEVLEAAEELVELQRFKLERQADDLHQAKSLESIHRDKRSEIEREFRDYKDRAESNSMRLAKEVCRLEDELQAAGIGVKGE
ncbi:TPA: hypothetical protein ACHTJK_000725 [Citrobacter freundii]